MSLTPEQRQKLISNSRGAAAAFLEDIAHIREVLKIVDHSRGDLRRLSSIMRRLLVDRDIAIVAAPRMGKISLRAPDNTPIYNLTGEPFVFFSSLGIEIFGIRMRAVSAVKGRKPQEFRDFDPDRMVDLRFDLFLSQRVMCFNGKWVSRQDVVKYAANIGSGVHSGSPKNDDEKIVDEIRRSCFYLLNGETVSLNIIKTPLHNPNDIITYSHKSIDATLSEVLASAHFVSISPDILTLERIVADEFQREVDIIAKKMAATRPCSSSSS